MSLLEFVWGIIIFPVVVVIVLVRLPFSIFEDFQFVYDRVFRK
jgi:hypothetical protein